MKRCSIAFIYGSTELNPNGALLWCHPPEHDARRRWETAERTPQQRSDDRDSYNYVTALPRPVQLNCGAHARSAPRAANKNEIAPFPASTVLMGDAPFVLGTDASRMNRSRSALPSSQLKLPMWIVFGKWITPGFRRGHQLQ